MGTTLACSRGRIGNTEYYLAKMKAGILINTVGFASQIPEWDSMSMEEKMQRELNEIRVINEITPYVVNDSNHFFGALIVDIYKGWEDIEFEPLEDIVKNVPKAYKDQVKDLGFITLPDNQTLIALDGQHRLLALYVAIRGYRGLVGGSTPLSEELKERLQPNPEIADEDISVILVPHRDDVLIRQIFNKVNRYAKSTTRSDNIVTSEDDMCAIITRKLLQDGEPLQKLDGKEVVNVKSNTLAKRSKQLTTLSAVYSFNEEILGDFNKDLRPSHEELDTKYIQVAEVWKVLLKEVNDFQACLNAIEGKGEIEGLREKSLLLKPVTQIALAIAYSKSKRRGISIQEFAERLNYIDWKFEALIWQQILVMENTKKVLTNKQAVGNAAAIIDYCINGHTFTTQEKEDLLSRLRLVKPNYELPQYI